MIDDVQESTTGRRFPCSQCGAKLVFAPGTTLLRCEHCGHETQIDASAEAVREQDFAAHLAQAERTSDAIQVRTVKCTACAAEVEPPAHATAFACPFCGSDIVAAAVARTLIKPRALLPFHVDASQAKASFDAWLKRLWFAPGGLSRFARGENRLNGVYAPYWTYDADTTSHYTGARGDDYWETQTYTTRDHAGRTAVRTRRVRRTRWTYVSGVVHNTFDDVLVVASRSLPRGYAEKLEPWDLHSLVPYDERFLSGFRAEYYQIDLREGFEIARQRMDVAIRATIRRDIGGDHQRIHSVRTRYDRITFKHILLPIWISAYRYKAKTYRFLVNARTGEVQGERPWSWLKITLFVLVCAAVVAAAGYAIILRTGGI